MHKRPLDLEHDDSGQLPGEGRGVDVVLGRDVRKPAHVHLAEPQVGQGVVVGQLGEDVGKVDAGRGPGRVKGHQPDHLRCKKIKKVRICVHARWSEKVFFRNRVQSRS